MNVELVLLITTPFVFLFCCYLIYISNKESKDTDKFVSSTPSESQEVPLYDGKSSLPASKLIRGNRNPIQASLVKHNWFGDPKGRKYKRIKQKS